MSGFLSRQDTTFWLGVQIFLFIVTTLLQVAPCTDRENRLEYIEPIHYSTQESHPFFVKTPTVIPKIYVEDSSNSGKYDFPK